MCYLIVIENCGGVLDSPPHILSINQAFAYATICGEKNEIYVIGPVSFDTPVSIKSQLHDIAVPQKYQDSLSICSFHDFANDILLIHNLFHEQQLSMDTLILENCIENNLFSQIQKRIAVDSFSVQEEGKKHNPYDQEIREFGSIEQGDLEQLE